MIIAIDGPAGAGKGTLAKALARRLNFSYLDTGLLYRALALKARDFSVDFQDSDSLVNLAETLVVDPGDMEKMRTSEIAEVASILAQNPQVRQALKIRMRFVAQHPEPGKKGVVLDGRDIGTIVCPQADVKFFITASLEERAKRRFLELQSMGFTGSVEEILRDVERRDTRDKNRTEDPLRPALDAVVVDTTSLDLDTVFKQAFDHVIRSIPDIVDSIESGR